MSEDRQFTSYQAADPMRRDQRKKAKQLCQALNALRADQHKARSSIYQQLFAQVGSAYIEPDFYCDYGTNIVIGERFYANHHCIILDGAAVTIGNRVMFGPNVHLYASTHPSDPHARANGDMLAAPITIGDDCWLGGNVCVMPGVTIGKASIIGAGSVVTRNIPSGVIAAGNPCRVLRKVNE